MKEEIEKLLKERLYNSFAQALIKLFSTPYLTLKIILALFSLSSSGLASYLVIQSIFAYLTYGVSLSSRTIFETPTLFPKVTFCNLNPLTTEYAYNQSQIGVNIQNLTIAEKKKLGHDLNDILIDCLFNLKQCDSNNFVWSYDPWYGNCYTFNSEFDSNGIKINLEKSNIAGYKFGLQFTLYVNIYEKFIFVNKNEVGKNSLVKGFGAVIRIENSSYSTSSDTNALFLSPGHTTFISVDREFKSILAKPFSNCEVTDSFGSNSYLYNLIVRSELVYSQQLCFTQCLQRNFIDKYNCSFSFLPSIFNASTCNSNVTLVIQEAIYKFDSNFINDICLPLCPLECKQNKYQTSISSNQMNNAHYNQYIPLIPNIANDFINRTLDATLSFAGVIVYYDSLMYRESIESPQMSIASLLGSIGGNLGLFLGVSVFSLCEVIEVFMEIIFIIKNRNRVVQ
jgi:hypothetical protein